MIFAFSVDIEEQGRIYEQMAMGASLVVLLFGSGVKRHVGKKACLFKSRGVKRHVVKSQSVNWHAVFRQSMKKGMSPLGFIRIQPQFKVNDSTPKYSAQ